VSADIYDINGRLVAPVLKKELGKGHHVLTWKARDSHGNAVPPGIYFCRMEASHYTEKHQDDFPALISMHIAIRPSKGRSGRGPRPSPLFIESLDKGGRKD